MFQNGSKGISLVTWSPCHPQTHKKDLKNQEEGEIVKIHQDKHYGMEHIK